MNLMDLSHFKLKFILFYFQLNFFNKFKSPPRESRKEIRTETVPKKRTFFFTGKPYTTNMGCIRSKEKEFDISNKQHEVKEPEKGEKKDTSEKTSDESALHKVLQQMREDCKKAHNVYRAKHKAMALKLNEDLNKLAQKWAEHLASIRTLKHSDCKWKDDIVGENIAYKWMSNGGEFTGKLAPIHNDRLGLFSVFLLNKSPVSSRNIKKTILKCRLQSRKID